MRIRLITIIAIFTINLTTSLFGQEVQIDEGVIGSWNFDYEMSLSEMDSTSKAHFENMDSAIQKRVIKSYQGRQLVLNENMTFSQISQDGSVFSGNWQIDYSNSTLTLTYGDGMRYPLRIIDTSETTLILVPQDVGKGKPLFQKWFYTKN